MQKQSGNTSFGGSQLKGHPKSARPIESNSHLLLVLRAERAVLGSPRNRPAVDKIVADTARKYGVAVIEYVNTGSDLHFLLKLAKRQVWPAFIRELTGTIAYAVKIRWKFRPFTRAVPSGTKAHREAKEFVLLTQTEASGRLKEHEANMLKNYRTIFG